MKQKKEHGKKEKAPRCDNCMNIAGIDILMRRAYQRIDNQWLPLGWYCPNCFSFEIDSNMKEARERSLVSMPDELRVKDDVKNRKINADGSDVIDEEATRRRAKEWAKINILLQRIYMRK